MRKKNLNLKIISYMAEKKPIIDLPNDVLKQ
jgi:hypothetical protein